MTRYVVSNSQVPHLWANQSQASARGNGSISFDGSTLYSYAAVIGELVQTSDGSSVALLVSRRWSNSTGKHQSYAQRAVYHLTSFTVPQISPIDHGANLAYLVQQYRDAVAAGFRKRGMSDHNFESVREQGAAARLYAETFALEHDALPIEHDIAELDAYHNSDEKQALRAVKREQEARAKIAAREARKAGIAIEVAEWRTGARHALARDAAVDDDGGALLRIAGNTLQTSLGAEVPLPHAVAVFKRVAACRDAGAAWQRNGDTLRVGSFQVDAINADGSFKAGCHSFNWSEIEHAARVAGVI